MNGSMKMVTKNYFGYLMNMEKRGKEELKYFLPALKKAVGDLFPVELENMEKKLRF